MLAVVPYATMVLTIIAMVLLYFYWKAHRVFTWVLVFPVFLMLLHTVIFYVFDILWKVGVIPNSMFSITNWSTMLRFHEMTTIVEVIGGVLLRNRAIKNFKEKQHDNR